LLPKEENEPAQPDVEPAMQTKLVQLFVSDGSALYLKGKILSRSFTCGEAKMLRTLGHEWTSLKADEEHYKTEPFPDHLKDAVLAR